MITLLYHLKEGDLPRFDISPEASHKIKVWEYKDWHNIDGYIRLDLCLNHKYYAQELDEKHLNIVQPNFGELLIVHSDPIGVLDPEEGEWFYSFYWGAAWLMHEKIFPYTNASDVRPSLQDAIQGLTVEFQNAFEPEPDISFSL